MSRPPLATPRGPRPTGRPGFTLTEMMISVTIMLLVFAMAVPFFRAQARSVEQNAQRLDARTGGRYGASSLDRDVRVAGIDMPPAQPLLVQAQYDALTVNGNLVATDTAQSHAVYVNPNADPAVTGSLTPSTSVTLPNSSDRYPTVTYRDELSGTLSNAETVSYWVAPDPGRPGFSALFRRVNRDDPRVVVRNVVVTEGVPVFRYYYVERDGILTEVPSSRMPLRHAVALHGDAADTGRVAFIDSVRVVRVRLQTVARDAQTGRVDTLTSESSIRIMNAGLLRRTTCGEAPRGVVLDSRVPLRAVVAGGAPRAEFAFQPSPDETGGERDVQWYVVYRRLESESDFGAPLTRVLASGGTSYSVEDPSVQPGARYVYAVAAVDCTPRISSLAVTSPVETPIP